MDNEAPNYASWVPEAGGYVANGKVVSKSPVYDSQGKLRLDIDTSILNGALQPQTQAQPNMSHSQTAVEGHNQLAQKQAGIFTANQEGSGEDVNSLMTGAGSLGSLNNNTENSVFGVTNTPATKSPVVEEPILSPVDQAMKELQEAIARGNDYQAQINAYTKLERLTGQDYSAEIQDLTTKRQQKIENIDNDYASQISTALMRGDTAEVDRLRAEQANWRQTVGYQDAMTQKYQTAREELDVDYQRTYWDGINDITQSLMQALPGILNFQYNPYQDTALQIAQGYATSRVKEQMNATGMYYSSMTQNAITKAVAELVPVYEKMAKEEAIQNFQLLQQTASFLVDLEQAQFNLWKGQLDVKFQANADKRAEIAAAWDKVNQLGYVDNETSAILGIPAGTESYATRKAYVDKLNQIDAEERKLKQDKELADYEFDLQKQKMDKQSEIDMAEYKEKAKIDYDNDVAILQEQNRLNKDYWSYQVNNPKPTSTNSSGGSRITYTPSGNVDYSTKPKGTATLAQLKADLADTASQEGYNITSMVDMLEHIWTDAKDLDEAYSAVKQAEVKTSSGTQKIFDTALFDSLGSTTEEKFENYSKYLSSIAVASLDGSLHPFQVFEALKNSEDKSEQISAETEKKFRNAYIKDVLLSDAGFGSNEKNNKAAIDTTTAKIEASIPYMTNDEIVSTYTKLFDEINNSSKKFDFDKSQMVFNNKNNSIIALDGIGDNANEFFAVYDAGDKSKQLAMVYIINKLAGKGENSSPISNSVTRDYVVSQLAKNLYDKSQSMSDGYSGLKYKKSYTVKWGD